MPLELTSLTDEELIVGIAGGLDSALLELYQRYGRAVYSVAFYVIRDVARAEEIAQDVFVNVWQKASQYEKGRGRPAAWLLNIARHRAIDVLRQQRRQIQASHSLDEGDLDHPDPEPGPDHPNRELYWMLEDLPPEQSQVIELSFFEGLTHEEIAAQLHIPPGTVKSRILLGLRKLRERMKSE